jgi:branched-chain amino acid transport system ATP-binding protein
LSESPAPLALYNVRAGYGRIEVLHGVNVEVRHGTITALLGPNGAGKTTTLSVMSGLLAPNSGCRHVAGIHCNGADASELARLGICHVREGRSVFPNLSVADNLTVAASAGATVERVTQVAYTLFPRLAERQHQLAGTLSGGEMQMLALARGLGTDPSVLLIDELSIGLAPMIVDELYEVVADVARSGVSVLIVEQFAAIGLRYATHAYVMANGLVMWSGASAEAEEALQSAYFGAAS